ncbi:MAG: DUF2169 domain-containing protein [Planctomycetes bacterium]|nr:DUF2169 domain-containing protein [Planctomycetota bacterium]
MDLTHPSELTALAAWTMDQGGRTRLLITMVGAFTCAGDVAEPEPIRTEDAFSGEAGASTVTAVTDLGWSKTATDVILYADALAPATGARSCSVSLAIGPIAKTVRVVGDRIWMKRLFRWIASDPQPFESMPLVWERAFGGTLTTRDGSPVMDERNPIGIGLYHPDADLALAGLRLPNIEHPAHLFTAPHERPDPAGFTPICAHWQPRRAFAGTYDDAWQRDRAPFVPADFDPRFLQCAPRDQIVSGHLSGDEEVRISGIAPLGEYCFRLPGVSPVVTVKPSGRIAVDIPSTIQTVTLRPAKDRVVLAWRAEWHGSAGDISAIRIAVRPILAGAGTW